MSLFPEIVDAEELAIMSEAFENHCLAHRIVDENARTDVAVHVMSLFKGGAKTVEEFTKALTLLRPF